MRRLLRDLAVVELGTEVRGYVKACEAADCGERFVGRLDARFCSEACASRFRQAKHRDLIARL